VRIFAPRELQWMRSPTMQIANSWLVDVLPNGSAAFREQGALTISKAAPSQELARIPLFAKQDYAPTRLADLRQAMKRALIAAGLYEEEADAMLETWKESYFQTPGLRVFYLVPNEWTQYFLPLQMTLPHELTRVLVGRVDIERTESN
jgi:hypothetical protein